MTTSKDIQNTARLSLVALGGAKFAMGLFDTTTDYVKLAVGLSSLTSYDDRLRALLDLANWVQPLGETAAMVITKASAKALRQLTQEVGPFQLQPITACLDLLAGTDPLQAALQRERGSCERYETHHKDRSGP